MGGNFYPYDQGDQAPTDNQPTYTPAPDQNPAPPPGAPKSKLKTVLIIAGAFVGILLVIMVVVLILSPKKKTVPAATQTKEDPFSLETIKADNIFIGDKQVAFSFQAPRNWHSQPITNYKVIYPWENATPVVGFDFLASGLGQVIGITADNQMILRDITEWLDLDQSSSNKLFTPANKKAQVQLLQTFDTNKPISQDEIKKVINFQASGTNLEVGGRQKPFSIVSSDNGLKGVSYMTILGPSYYDPQIIVMMAGKINDKNVYLYGDFVVHDQLYKKLGTKEAADNKNWAADTKKAIEDFRSGNISDDALKIYEEAQNAIKSIKIENVTAE